MRRMAAKRDDATDQKRMARLLEESHARMERQADALAAPRAATNKARLVAERAQALHDRAKRRIKSLKTQKARPSRRPPPGAKTRKTIV